MTRKLLKPSKADNVCHSGLMRPITPIDDTDIAVGKVRKF